MTEVSEQPPPVTITNSQDFNPDDVDPADDFPTNPVLPSTVVASTTYKYSVNAVSSLASPIPTVRWKITIDGPVALSVGMVHVDEMSWEDVLNGFSMITFHYPMIVVGGNLVATGSCAAQEPGNAHSNACATDDFGVDANDNFTNVDSIHFDASAPSGGYVIKRQLVNT